MKDVMDRRVDASAMSKHMMECHSMMELRLKAKLVMSYNMSLKHYIYEALHLYRLSKNNVILNMRGEWGKFKLPQLQIARTGNMLT